MIFEVGSRKTTLTQWIKRHLLKMYSQRVEEIETVKDLSIKENSCSW